MATIKKAQKGTKVRTESGKMVDKKEHASRQDSMVKAMNKQYFSRPENKKSAPKKMKNGGKSFPDLNKDGKVTKADILVGRGVIKAKKGVKVAKKAQVGVALRSNQLKRLGRLSAKNPDKAKEVGSRMVERATRKKRGKEFVSKNLSELMPKSKYGSKMKKCKYGCK